VRSVFDRLRASRLSALGLYGSVGGSRRACLRTHANHARCRACHSRIDDAYVLVPAAGFLSLVVPNFALGPVGFGATHLVEMRADGDWVQRDPEEVFAYV
jgi:hypothetical protein